MACGSAAADHSMKTGQGAIQIEERPPPEGTASVTS